MTEKLTVIELRHVCLLLTTIPSCQALGFEADCKLDDLSDSAIKQFKYGQKKIQTKVDRRVNALKEVAGAPVSDQIEFEKFVAQDPEIKELLKEEEKFMQSQVEFKFEPIEIPLLDYSKEFPKGRVGVTLLGKEFEVNAYAALMELRRRGIIKVIQPQNEKQDVI